MFRRASAIAACVLVVVLATPRARALEPHRPGQENSIMRAVFAEQRLWVLSDAGELSSVAPGGKDRLPSGLPEPVLDICSTGGKLRALTCANESCTLWDLVRIEDGHWVDGPIFSSESDGVAALGCTASGSVLLTSRRIVELSDKGAQGRLLSRGFDAWGVTSMHVANDELLVGENKGEWGGGLTRVERRTGKVTVVEAVQGNDLCAGPLNPACDPVNAIVEEPWRAGCVLAAVGLVHFTAHGRLVELCSGQVRSVYYRAYDPKGASKGAALTREPFRTIAFFGLVRTGKTLLAMGVDGLYGFSGTPQPTRIRLPQFTDIDGISVSFALPNVVLVLTTVNQRSSVSGAVPLLVPRSP